MMERNRASTGFIRIALTALVVLGATSARSWADLPIVSDSYVIGSDPTQGQYIAGTALSAQLTNLTNPGFVNGGYIHGTGTANFLASATGLSSIADGATANGSGSVYWDGTTSSTVKSVARNLTAFNEGTTGTYWMSMLVSADGTQTTTDGWVLSGFGGSVAPTLGLTSTSAINPVNPTPGFLTGIYVGFSDDSNTANEADLVLRYRNTTGQTSADQILVNGANNATANQTYLVVAQVNVNYKGALDQVNYWVNPPDLNSIGDLNSASTLTSGSLDTYAFQGQVGNTNDFARLNYAAYDWDGDANFDEARLGTTLSSIAIPEPTSLMLSVIGGGIFLVGSIWRRGRRSGR